jgi:hypothetical protein
MNYVTKVFPDFVVSRSPLPADSIIAFDVSVGDLLYRTNDGSVLTFLEGTSNTSLVGTTLNPDTLLSIPNVFGPGPIRFLTGNTQPFSYTVVVLRDKNAVNPQLINVSDSYTVPANTFAVLVEGTITAPVGNTTTTMNVDEDIYAIGKKEQQYTVTGNGKLVIFDIN